MPKSRPRIAVLLAAYNGDKWIKEQIDTIMAQKEVEVQVFISVDLSADSTYQLCKQFEEVESRITVLPYGECFGGAAKNFFRLIKDVDFISFDYVSLSDQDDIWFEDKLCSAVNKIKEKNLDAFSSDVIAFWEDGREKLVKKSFPFKKYDFLFESAGPGCTYVFKSNSLARFKFFLIENFNLVSQVALHDWMIYAYMRYNKMQWCIDVDSSMLYRQHLNNQIGFNSGFHAYKRRAVLVKKKWYRSEVEKISGLLNINDVSKKWFRIKNFWQLRRRMRDVFALLVMNLLSIY